MSTSISIDKREFLSGRISKTHAKQLVCRKRPGRAILIRVNHGVETMPEGQRPKPQPTPETQHFWDGTKTGELRLQRCGGCGKVYFPPRPFCPGCASREVSVFAASGKGRLYSYVIHHRPVPGFTPPYAIAVVE